MIRHEANKPVSPALGIFSPLRYAVFRRIWTASLLSNLGLLVLGVGAAWSMTKISSSTSIVALVQTSLMLPVALVSTPAGAIADMFDRRIVGLVALSIALAGSISLSALAWLGVMTPALLLVSCFTIGSGMALFGPAWQASVSEQVPAEALPAAVALNGISYNIARSFGPTIGGVIVASAGAVTAFITNALLYLPLLIVLFFWRRLKEPSRLPPERLARAVISGVRYIVHSPPIRIVLGRTLVTGIAGVSVSALMPIVARDLLRGGAQTYGVVLGAFGMGAVIGALNISKLRGRLGDEVSILEASIGRYKRVIGDALKSRADDRRKAEVAIAVKALNRMRELGQAQFIRLA
jgi:MFS family permease